MASERTWEEPGEERGSLPLDIDDVHVLLQVEQEQIQKRTFTNWVNAQLSKRRPPVAVLDLFNDFRDGSRLLDLLEVMCSQRLSREKGRGVFQHRMNIERALAFLRGKSIKLVNINVPDIMDGKPSIILGLIWTIIMHFHIEELASTLSFSSRQSSLESLASLDTRSTNSSARSSPVPPGGSPLHTRFRISAKKALLLWVREQCHKAGCTLTVKDFKVSWRSGVVFLAILCALRPDVVSLSKAKTRSNRQNLEEAFHVAERELHIPRLLDPADVDVRDPDEKSIMTYVAQFLQYSKDLPASEDDMQVQYLSPTASISPVNLPCDFTPAVATSPLRQTSTTQKVQEVTCWLEQAYQELLEGWECTEDESYAERYHVFQTFVVSFNEQRRPVMPLLTAMKRTGKLSEEQRALRHAWDSLAEKLREYKTELDLSLPSPLDTVGRWLLRAEEALVDGNYDRQAHTQAAQEAREKHELFKLCLEEMPRHVKTFQIFQNTSDYGDMMVPSDKLEEIKRRFTTVRVSAKYHGIRLEYQEHRHTVLDLLAQLTLKLRTWKRGYISQETVRVLMKDFNETVNKQGLPSLLEGTLCKLRHIANKYTSKSALAGDANRVSNQMKDLEAETAAMLEEVKMVKGTIARTLTAWDSYCDTYSSLQAWLEQGTQSNRHGQQAEVTVEMMSEWSSYRERLNEVGNYLMDVTDPQTSRSISDDLCRINLMWAEFVKRTQFELVEEQSLSPPSPQSLQGFIREAKQLLKEPVEVLSGSLITYRKRLQFMIRKIQDVELESLSPSLECSAETLNKLKQAIPEVLQTLCEAVQVCEELQQNVSSLDVRLAELINWEVEIREYYELVNEKSRHQRGQDPRTRSLISKGLQLEGQVVMEEQDLQEMVMSRQKNSPLQYLIASTMQDRVRATVAQSQEALGMLSSLGSRRDRSPTGHQPPQKVFIQEQEVSPETPPQPVPVIVVQEYQEEKGQTQTVTKSQLMKEAVEDFPGQKKAEADTPLQNLPEVRPHSELVGAVALGEPKRRKRGDDKKSMESQDTEQTPEQIQQAPTRQQPLTVQQEPTQLQMELDTQQQTRGQQQQARIQKQGESQQQTVFHRSMKIRKSQKRAENRPWIQQKAQAEVLAQEQMGEVPPQPKVITTAVSPSPVSISDQVQAQTKVTRVQQQQPVTITTSVRSQAQISTSHANQTQAKMITQTHAEVTQGQQQHPVLQVNEPQQQHPMTVFASVASQPTMGPVQSEPKSVTQTQFQVTQSNGIHNHSPPPHYFSHQQSNQRCDRQS
ncbi:nesprin-2-like [Clarias gariepinus]